ncbi:MAG: hypothetical protein GX039_05370 [Clostridia bacterium]|nr:hypothetical protein [Clostridia bacterium]
MLIILFFLIALLLGFFLAVKAKVRLYQRSKLEVSASPVSQALAELVAVAGGIYLSLVLLVSFLKINIAEVIMIGQFQIDPLAAVALVIALLQPLILNLWQYLKGR